MLFKLCADSGLSRTALPAPVPRLDRNVRPSIRTLWCRDIMNALQSLRNSADRISDHPTVSTCRVRPKWIFPL